jgi:pimeloyl-ACP methyl ester carboxylesterase
MGKLLIFLAIVLPCGPFLLARQAVNDLPQRVEGGGHLLRFRVEGTGSPTVVLEIGLGGFVEEWAAVQPEVARFTRVVAYDRIGAHHTEPTLTGQEVINELRAALENASLKPPYVLVGQSFGGVYIRLFAAMYPDEVVGLVLLDPSQDEFIAWMQVQHPEEEFSKKNHRDWPEANGVRQTLEQLKASQFPPSVPTIVVTAARPQDDPLWRAVFPMWLSSHEKWAQSLPKGRHVLAPQSGHGVQVEAPELVVGLIREVVQHARDAKKAKDPAAGAQP